MVSVILTQSAKQDFYQIYNNLELISPAYSKSFALRFNQIVIKISKFPQLGRIVPEIENPRIRELFDNKYRVIYRIKSDDEIEILMIYHGARDLKI